MVEQGIQYLILLHFANFVTVYFADPEGIIVTVKNFDRKRDRQALAELPRVARRILEYPRKKKVPAKHEQLLKKINVLQKHFYGQIRAIENLVGVRLPSRNFPGITLTPQEQKGVIYIPTEGRTQPYLTRFFLIEAFRLFLPTIFQLQSDLLAPFFAYLYLEDTTERMALSQNFTNSLNEMIEHIPTESLTRQQIRPFLSLLRWWARYEDRSLDIKTFQSLFMHAMIELTQRPSDSRTQLVAAISMKLFQSRGDPRDLLRSVCALILLNSPTQNQIFRTSEVFLSKEEIPRICLAMLTKRFCPLYQTRFVQSQLSGNPKLARLFHQAFDHIKTQILHFEQDGTYLKLVNQSDLELCNITVRYSSSNSQEMITFVPQLAPDHECEIILSHEPESEQIIVEFTDQFLYSYHMLV